MSDKLWNGWTLEDWKNAKYCEDCGLPLISFEDASDGVEKPQCVYCTWSEDESIINAGLRNKIAALKKISDLLYSKLCQMTHLVDSVPQSVQDAIDEYNKHK